MEEQGKIRLLKADEIECRVSTIGQKGLSLLLYKDARVDQKILDETFTIFGWKRSHQLIDGNLYCTVEIWNEQTGQWVAKQDVGTESYSAKEKGQASDSFKRACFNVGIGRELYTAPFIWIPAAKANIYQKDDRYYTNDRFTVRLIRYDSNRNICALSIVNSRQEVVYSMELSSFNGGSEENISREQIDKLKKELKRTGVALGTVLERYHIQSPEQFTSETYEKAMDCLRRSRDKVA